MNVYLVYLSTIISSYLFNTINYVRNKNEIRKIKNKKLIFKKDLSRESKKSVLEADLIPSLYYLGSSLCAFLPICNIFVPEKSKNLYYDSDMEKLAEEFYDIANEQEIIQRYSNGIAMCVLEELGYEIPDKYKAVSNNTIDLNIDEKLKDDIVSILNAMIGSDDIELLSLDSINPISNKEFKKRERKILRMNRNREVNIEK